MRADHGAPVIRPLLAQFGDWAVWRASVETLGYPPTWIRDVSELKQLIKSLNR